MTLTFLGTRGYIEARTRRHQMHTALLVAHRRGRVMIDCGEDWTHRVGRLRPQAILVTHAHPDHAGGLRNGSPCPVYATTDAWRGMARFSIPRHDRRLIAPRRPRRIAGIGFEAFRVVHSILAPAVGYRIRAGGVDVFYVPDVLAIPERAEALGGVDLYIGDGACIVRPIVRRRGRTPFGHASIRAQLEWCRAEGVTKAIFTHCGTQIVAGNPRRTVASIEGLARTNDVEVWLAEDGLTLKLAPGFRKPGNPPGHHLRFMRRGADLGAPCRGGSSFACPGMAARLKARHVLMVVAPTDFRDEELLQPKSLFEAEGAVVEVASTTRDVVRGMLGAEVKPDITLSAVDPHRYAAIALVGGSGAPTYLWDNHTLHALLRIARDGGTPIGAICLSPAALARAGLLRGVRATVYGDQRAKHELERGGALYVEEHVVSDQGIVTAAGPRDARAFAEALVHLVTSTGPQGQGGGRAAAGVSVEKRGTKRRVVTKRT
jgi:PfpI family intracellular protease